MITYLLLHFQLSLIFLAVLFVCSFLKSSLNKTHLIILYTLVMKSVFPWGLLSIPPGFLLRKKIPGGFSIDASYIRTSQSAHFMSGYSGTDKLILSFWAAIALIFLFIMIRGLIKVDLITRKAVSAEGTSINLIHKELISSNCINNVQLKITEKTESAFIWWNGSWSVIIPKRVLTMEYNVQKTIIAHELAHIMRNDLVKHIILGILKSLFFFSPFIRFAVSEIIAREEIETDHLAMKTYGLTPLCFGESILKFISVISSFRYAAPSLTGSSKRRLKMRLEYLFQYRKPGLKKLSGIILISTVIMVLITNCASENEGKKIKNGFCRPVSGGTVTMDYGKRIHPIKKEEFFHKGVDIAEVLNSPVYSAADGKISATGFDNMLGNYILISHKNNLESFYTHLGDITVEKDKTVKMGEKIASVGNTGLSTGPHLHFEIHKNGNVINPHTIMDID